MNGGEMGKEQYRYEQEFFSYLLLPIFLNGHAWPSPIHQHSIAACARWAIYCRVDTLSLILRV